MIQLKHPLVLASESPRRKQLLTEANFSFVVFPVKVSESLEKNLNLDEALIELSKRKVNAALEQHNFLKTDSFLILAADTMVVLDGKPLGKPTSKIDAEQTLGLLSGKKHEVKTAICVFDSSTKKFASDIETTKVYFRPISRQEVLDYVATGEPMDKAGSYGIQGLGGKFVEKYMGSLDNVIGLPILLLKKILKENNWMKEEV